VTDTHALLWYGSEKDHKKLSRNALRAFQAASRSEALIWAPSMVVWEAGLISRAGHLKVKPSVLQWAFAIDRQPGFALASLDADVVDVVLNIQLTADIFDLAIIATARAKDLPLITKDAWIVDSGLVPVVW